MRQLTIELPDALYTDLENLAKQQHDPSFGPTDYCEELIVCELASRRVTVMPGKTETHYGPVEYRIALPEKRV